MNYNQEVFNDVFTLAHEAGHSMHTWHSARHQPYQYYGYVIFVAEVASTFNEELLSHHLLKNARDNRQRAYLVNREIDDIRATIVRQTMFAEFEDHARNGGSGRGADGQSVSRHLPQAFEDYFGPRLSARRSAFAGVFADSALFIGHFTSISTPPAFPRRSRLSQRVLRGGKKELDDYLGFLKGGCSKDPLDLCVRGWIWRSRNRWRRR